MGLTSHQKEQYVRSIYCVYMVYIFCICCVYILYIMCIYIFVCCILHTYTEYILHFTFYIVLVHRTPVLTFKHDQAVPAPRLYRREDHADDIVRIWLTTTICCATNKSSNKNNIPPQHTRYLSSYSHQSIFSNFSSIILNLTCAPPFPKPPHPPCSDFPWSLSIAIRPLGAPTFLPVATHSNGAFSIPTLLVLMRLQHDRVLEPYAPKPFFLE